MLTNLKVQLEKEEYVALEKSADDDIRSSADQARHILREALKERQLLDKEQAEQKGEQKCT